MNFGGVIRLNKAGAVGISFCVVLLLILYKTSYSDNEIDLDSSQLVNLKKLLSVAVSAAERGGNEVRRVRQMANLNEKSKGETKEGVKDPVTDGDMLSHIQMFYSIKKVFPNIEVISEEHEQGVPPEVEMPPLSILSSSEAGLSDQYVPADEVKVWIDPLDATKEYTENLLQYVTTMVCVAVKGYATIGIIHKPFENTTVWGWVGKDVSKNLQVSKNLGGPKDDIPSIIVSRSHTGNVQEAATAAFGAKTQITPAGGAGYKTLEVIKGNSDAYVHTTRIKKWDLCAGNAILNSLNGQMTTLDGENINYDNKDDYINDHGLLATLYEHKFYLDKLKNLKQ